MSPFSPRPSEGSSEASSAEITQLLLRWRAGEKEALGELLPLLYEQLRQMARGRLRGERAGHTLGPTALVHEAYLRLTDVERIDWEDRAHFLAVASTTMRRVLVDWARKRRAQKRGGAAAKVPLSKVPLSKVPLSKGSLDKGALGRVLPGEELIPAEKAELMLELEDALGRMARAHGRASRAVELYYFGGLTLAEIGEVLGVSAATAMRDLRFAKAWLAREWGGAAE